MKLLGKSFVDAESLSFRCQVGETGLEFDGVDIRGSDHHDVPHDFELHLVVDVEKVQDLLGQDEAPRVVDSGQPLPHRLGLALIEHFLISGIGFGPRS